MRNMVGDDHVARHMFELMKFVLRWKLSNEYPVMSLLALDE